MPSTLEVIANPRSHLVCDLLDGGLALLALKGLDRDYPNDLQIKSMLGTLWLQLNQPDLARESWEAALKLDPQNKSLIEALRQLNPASSGDDPDEE